MPFLSHSALYDQYSHALRLFSTANNPIKLNNLIAKSSYLELKDLLLEAIDAQNNIVRIVGPAFKCSTQIADIRDATEAFPLEHCQRVDLNDPQIEKYNAALRVLGCVRGIDHVLAHGNPIFSQKLREKFNEFLITILSLTTHEAIKHHEAAFNGFLFSLLHQANLAKDCQEVDSGKKLLFHYRNLSSLLEPARALVTICFDKKNNTLHRETLLPITQKLDTQKSVMAEMATRPVTPKGKKDPEKNYHNTQSMAFQMANYAFAHLLMLDDRAIGSQARKTILPGVKNAFYVIDECIPNFNQSDLSKEAILFHPAPTEHTLNYIRYGSPVFVGKGEPDSRIAEHTLHNREQMKAFILQQTKKRPLFHAVLLNTNIAMEHQDTICKHIQGVMENEEDSISYIPVNAIGAKKDIVVLSHQLSDTAKQQIDCSRQFFDANRYLRYQAASAAILHMQKEHPNTINVINCASGQDRTGTVCFYTALSFKKERYIALGFDTESLEALLAAGGAAAAATTHTINGGSPGLKADSHAKDLFFPKTDEVMYLISANTNKQAPIDKKSIDLNHQDMLVMPNLELLERYEEDYTVVSSAIP